MKDILCSLRNKNNYSQSAVASYLEISRQMYNRYERGIAEPSLKNIKKLCELYKVSADVFFDDYNTQNKETTSYIYQNEPWSDEYVASDSVPYGNSNSQTDSNSILAELLKLIPLLKLNEQITLMSRLALTIEKQTCLQQSPVLKTKKIKKIPDAEYNNFVNSSEMKTIRKSSLAAIREILKNDEW